MEDLASLPEIDGPYDSSADAFYEEIEAPKFVDLTEKDPIRVDDRYWFCSRVGCDQKHDEELDSEQVYKNFVLRVMAARSPNVRLHKALNRRCGTMTNAKCPQSAPPKSTRLPVSNLAVVASSIAAKVDGLKSKCNQKESKASVTPNPKVRVVGAKYMTSLRNKNTELKHDGFRSVQNPKKGEGCVGEVKSRVAKALVFHSPKKTVKLKASLELKTPVRKICDKLKKLELDEGSRKMRVLGYSSTSSGASKPKATTIRPLRMDSSSKVKKAGLAENKKRKSNQMSQTCEKKLSESPDENQDSENLRQVEKAAEEPQSAPVSIDHILAEANDDDKENESGTDQNRCKSGAKPEESRSAGRKVPTSEKTNNKFIKMTRTAPNPKEGGAAANGQVLKYRKPKPTNPKPFRLRTDERGILKEANSEKKVQSAGKCHRDIISESDSKHACKIFTKPNSNSIKEAQEKPLSLTRKLKKPSIAGTTHLEHSKVITAAKTTTTATPEKPKSILISSKKRKTVTPNRENIARKPTVSFILPEEKTPEVSRATEIPRKVLIKKPPAMANKSPIPKNSYSVWRLP